jgi:adenylosuccinate lyase
MSLTGIKFYLNFNRFLKCGFWRGWSNKLYFKDWAAQDFSRGTMATTKQRTDVYSNPLLERYASAEMSYVFSPDFKFGTWRKLWVALAECEMDLGLPVTMEQVDEMKAHQCDIDYDAARSYEAKTRHDVMAHILAFGDKCPKAKPVIHLGATSAFVGDNTDLIQMKEALRILLARCAAMIAPLRDFALAHKDAATLGFTHFQPAQLTTVGKRACLWLYDLVMDFEALEQLFRTMRAFFPATRKRSKCLTRRWR